jgi:hypothetical protein
VDHSGSIKGLTDRFEVMIDSFVDGGLSKDDDSVIRHYE